MFHEVAIMSYQLLGRMSGPYITAEGRKRKYIYRRILMWKPEGRPERGWIDIIKEDLRDIPSGGVD
jgi:hypothetical protein